MVDEILCGDCLEVMPTLEDKSVDMVLADLPYGVTACKWDTPLPLDDLWSEWLRICKGAIVLTGTQPFTTTLIDSNRELFRYSLVWDKLIPRGFLNANRIPMRCHEDIIIFYEQFKTYNPQKEKGIPLSWKASKNYIDKNKTYQGANTDGNRTNYSTRFPRSIIRVMGVINNSKEKSHPTQKPVALFEYLIRTYTNEGDTVLDPTAGSGTTAVACHKSNRHYICIEKEPEYCAIAEKRLAEML